MEPVGEVSIDFQTDLFSLNKIEYVAYLMYPAFLFSPSILTSAIRVDLDPIIKMRLQALIYILRVALTFWTKIT